MSYPRDPRILEIVSSFLVTRFLGNFDGKPGFSLYGTAKHELQKRPHLFPMQHRSKLLPSRGSLSGTFDCTVGSSGASDVASALAFVEGE